MPPVTDPALIELLENSVQKQVPVPDADLIQQLEATAAAQEAEKNKLLETAARADQIKAEADKQLKQPKPYTTADIGKGPGLTDLVTGQPRPLTGKEVGVEVLEGGGLERLPLTNSPVFMGFGLKPVAMAGGLLSKLLGATAVGGVGGAVAPFVGNAPTAGEALKEVPASVAENVAAYTAGEAIGYPLTKAAARVLRGNQTLLTGKSTTPAATIAGKVVAPEVVRPLSKAEEAVLIATTNVGKQELRAGFKPTPKAVGVIGEALDNVAKTKAPIQVALKEANDKYIETNARSVVKVAQQVTEPPDVSGSVVRDIKGDMKPMYHGTSYAFEEFDPAKISQDNLYGKGFYFTDDYKIAGGDFEPTLGWTSTDKVPDLGYAKPKGLSTSPIPYETLDRYKDKLKELQIEYDNASPRQQKLLAGKLADQRTAVESLESSFSYPNVHKVYLDIKNPFDIDAPANPELVAKLNALDVGKLSENYIGRKSDWIMQGKEDKFRGMLQDVKTNNDIYEALDTFYGDKNIVNDLLKEEGYDGIKHIGGARTNNPPHNVYIAFDKKQIIPAWDYDAKLKSWREQLTRYNNAEPEFENGLPVQGKLYKFDTNSGIDNQEFAWNRFETIDPDINEATSGVALVKKSMEKPGYQGLPPLTDDLRELMARKHEIDTGNPGIVMPPRDGSIPPELIPPQGGTPFQLPPPDNTPPVRFPIGISGMAPTNRIANIFEANNGIPTSTKLYYGGRKAVDRVATHVETYSKQIEDIFGPMYGFTKSKRAQQENVTRALEVIHAYDTNGGTFNVGHANGSFTSNLDLADATRLINQDPRLQGVHVTPEQVLVAGKLRKFYDDAHLAGAVNPQQYQNFYSPRYQAFKDENQRFNWIRGYPKEQDLAFFQHPRTGNLMPREENALKLAERYIRAWASAKYIYPWDNEVAKPILKQIGEREGKLGTVALDYFKNYRDSVVGTPDKATTKFNAFVDSTIDNLIGYKHPDLAETLRARFTEDRTGEMLGSKLVNSQMKGFLGWRPVPAVRNATQRLFAMPLMPKNEYFSLTRGLKRTATKEGQEKIAASEILGPIAPFISGDAAPKWHSPLKVYEAIEQNNRGAVYLSIHDAVNKDFLAGKTYSEVADNLRLHLYAKPVRDEFKKLYEAGAVGDVRTHGIDNNAAHWLGDWATIMTQFPYEKGANAKWIRNNPISRQMGVFQSWSLYAGDYLANLTRSAAKGDNKVKDFGNIAKMLGYFTLLDVAFENATGIPLLSNPLSSIPSRLVNAPVPSLITSGYTSVATLIDELMADITGERKNKYIEIMRKQANREFGRTLPGFFPGGKLLYDTFKGKKKEAVDISGD